MYMISREFGTTVSPNYIWRDEQGRGFVVGGTVKNILGNVLSRSNSRLHTEFSICDPYHRLGRQAMHKQEGKRFARLFEPLAMPTEIDPKVLEIRNIVTINRTDRLRGLGLEREAMLVGPIVLGEVIDWSREVIGQGELKITDRNQGVLKQAFAEYAGALVKHELETEWN